MVDKETVIVSLCAFGVPCRMHGQHYKMGCFVIGREQRLSEKIIMYCHYVEQLWGDCLPQDPIVR